MNLDLGTKEVIDDRLTREQPASSPAIVTSLIACLAKFEIADKPVVFPWLKNSGEGKKARTNLRYNVVNT